MCKYLFKVSKKMFERGLCERYSDVVLLTIKFMPCYFSVTNQNYHAINTEQELSEDDLLVSFLSLSFTIHKSIQHLWIACPLA